MAKVFNAQSTTDEVLEGVDLSGKRILVTGASAGLGIETMRTLQTHGAEVVGAARDLGKAARALSAAGVVNAELVACDLASLKSVRTASKALLTLKPFDVIIANAGVMACPEGKTEDGFETQFGTNHLGHFTLVNALAPVMPSGGRIVILSSGAHIFADVDLDDPGFTKTPYHPFVAYGRSKTANALYAVALDKRLKGRCVRVNSVHPGVIQTELSRHLTPDVLASMAPRRAEGEAAPAAPAMIYKTIPQGAATSVWSGITARSEDVGGRYCEDCHVAEIATGGMSGVRPYALDAERAEALWSLSEKMVGQTFAF